CAAVRVSSATISKQVPICDLKAIADLFILLPKPRSSSDTSASHNSEQYRRVRRYVVDRVPALTFTDAFTGPVVANVAQAGQLESERLLLVFPIEHANHFGIRQTNGADVH